MTVDSGDPVRELESALLRYIHLLKGGKVDVKRTLEVERIEQDIITELLGDEDTRRLLKENDLQQALSKLRASGLLDQLVERVSQAIGEEVHDLDNSLEAFYTGKEDEPGFKSVFITIQAVARAKATLYEEANGKIENPEPVCPVCGAVSKTMVKLGPEEYGMVCPFCGYIWIVSRTGFVCPFCGNRDKLSLGVFTGKKAKRLGLAWCQACGATWYVVLDRSIQVPRLLLPVLARGAEIYRGALEGAAQSAERSSQAGEA